MGHAPERAYDHVIQVNISPILTAVYPSGEMVGHLRISVSHWGWLIWRECAKEAA